MRWLVCLLLCGCAFEVNTRDDFLPLSGDFADLSQQPQLTTFSFYPSLIYPADDGRIWVLFPSSDPGQGPTLRSLESPSQTLALDDNASLTPEGIMDSVSLDPLPSTQFTITLTTPGQSAKLTRDVTMMEPGAALFLTRGSGYFVAPDPEPPYDPNSPSPSPWPMALHFFLDDGRAQSLDDDPVEWYPVFLDGNTSSPPTLGPRFAIVRGDPDAPTLAAYDLQQQKMQMLFAQPNGVLHQVDGVTYDESFALLYDQPREKFWAGGDHTYLADLTAAQVTELPFAAIEMSLDSSTGEVFLQTLDGGYYAVTPDGAATLLGTFDLHDVKARFGHTLVYSKAGHDNLDKGAYDAWLGDREFAYGARAMTFSVDGARLYWLESAANDQSVGDLYAMDVASSAIHQLVHNVTQFIELPDGRLAAIGDAALEGSWNRAVIVDQPLARVTRLAEGIQSLFLVGGKLVLGRHMEGSEQIFLAPPF